MEENILTRLPVKSISRFRCVSKKWRFLFQNPNFIQKHLNHAILMNNFNILVTNGDGDIQPSEAHLYCLDNDVIPYVLSPPFLVHALDRIEYPFMGEKSKPVILGSCNGLVWIETSPDGHCIWNPATGEYKKLPPDPSADSDGFTFTYYGFVFDCKNDDYKLLVIGTSDDEEDSQARLHSLASNSWKNLGLIPYDFTYSECKGLLHNDVLHWIAHRLECQVIVCFDISDETFHDLPLPINSLVDVGAIEFISKLGIWDGKLCLLHTNHMEDPFVCTHDNDHIDVWTLIDCKWSKHLKITAQVADISYRRPIQILQNGDILLEGGPRGKRGFGLMAYDPNFDRASALTILTLPDVPEVETYIETLVALNSGTYVRRLRGKDSISSRCIGWKDEIEKFKQRMAEAEARGITTRPKKVSRNPQN